MSPQVFSMQGISPKFIALHIWLQRPISRAPSTYFSLNILGRHLFITFFLSSFTCETNSYLMRLKGRLLRFCRSVSDSVGRTMTKQSFSLKKPLIIRRTRFLLSIVSEIPCFSASAFSKYFFDVISFPFLSSNLKAKSLTTHKKEGKVFINYSNIASLFFWSCLFRFI